MIYTITDAGKEYLKKWLTLPVKYLFWLDMVAKTAGRAFFYTFQTFGAAIVL